MALLQPMSSSSLLMLLFWNTEFVELPPLRWTVSFAPISSPWLCLLLQRSISAVGPIAVVMASLGHAPTPASTYTSNHAWILLRRQLLGRLKRRRGQQDGIVVLICHCHFEGSRSHSTDAASTSPHHQSDGSTIAAPEFRVHNPRQRRGSLALHQPCPPPTLHSDWPWKDSSPCGSFALRYFRCGFLCWRVG